MPEKEIRSYLVEFHRFGKAAKPLENGERYILARESLPLDPNPRELSLGPEDYKELVSKLVYCPETTLAERTEAMSRLGTEATDLLHATLSDALELAANRPVQVDLVLNAAELSSLPFELARDPDGEYVFARAQPELILTRRVRQPRRSFQYPSVSNPRVLFAYSQAAGSFDPKPHILVLKRALKAWSEPLGGVETTAPDADKVLTVLPELSLDALEQACRESVAEKKPFTHVHLLAHGTYSKESGGQFRLGLHSTDGREVVRASADDVAQRLDPLLGFCEAVTVAACNAGRVKDSASLDRSIAHELHAAGFPVVLASQFPLTHAGAVVMADEFYRNLLEGQDVRTALHRTRLRLKNLPWHDVGHDWASLVGYVSLPANYPAHLYENRLRSQLAALRTARRWTRLLVHESGEIPDREQLAERLQTVESALTARIRQLKTFLPAEETATAGAPGLPPGTVAETYGLIASAEKSLAELLAARTGISKTGPTVEDRAAVHEALERSRHWYAKSFNRDIGKHWHGVQSLSLTAVLDGKVDPTLWSTCLLSAQVDTRRDSCQSIWGWGSIVELHMLAPFANIADDLSSPSDAEEAMSAFKKAVDRYCDGDKFYVESTRRQLSHYITWWKDDPDLLPGCASLAEAARKLIDLLDAG